MILAHIVPTTAMIDDLLEHSTAQYKREDPITANEGIPMSGGSVTSTDQSSAKLHKSYP
jgi:hypothetical protein